MDEIKTTKLRSWNYVTKRISTNETERIKVTCSTDSDSSDFETYFKPKIFEISKSKSIIEQNKLIVVANNVRVQRKEEVRQKTKERAKRVMKRGLEEINLYCDACKGSYNRTSMKRHLQTKKHQTNIASTEALKEFEAEKIRPLMDLLLSEEPLELLSDAVIDSIIASFDENEFEDKSKFFTNIEPAASHDLLNDLHDVFGDDLFSICASPESGFGSCDASDWKEAFENDLLLLS